MISHPISVGPPPGIKGMTELDRDAFNFKAIFPALEIDLSWLETLMKVKALRDAKYKLEGETIDGGHLLRKRTQICVFCILAAP